MFSTCILEDRAVFEDLFLKDDAEQANTEVEDARLNALFKFARRKRLSSPIHYYPGSSGHGSRGSHPQGDLRFVGTG